MPREFSVSSLGNAITPLPYAASPVARLAHISNAASSSQIIISIKEHADGQTLVQVSYLSETKDSM